MILYPNEGEHMKRFVSVVLVAAAMFAVIAVTGCRTIRFPATNDSGYVEATGDVPKVGDFIRVRKILMHETVGLNECDIMWSYYTQESGSQVCTVYGGTLPGVGEEGTYAVVRAVAGRTYYARVK